jgi:hypothetical protein
MRPLRRGDSAPFGVKNTLPHANKKTVMLIGFMRLRTEKGGIWVQCDLNHIGQGTGNRDQGLMSEEVKK